MQFGKRRDFLKFMGSAIGLPLIPFGPLTLMAFAEDRKRDVMPGPSFYQNYMTYFHDWYCRTHFDFNRHFTSQEKEFVRTCIAGMKSWAFDLSDQVSLSTLTYSHRVKGEKVNSSRLGYGSFQNDDPAQKLAREICRKRGVSLAGLYDSGKAMGLGWDIESELFKVYFYEENLQKQSDPEMTALLAKAKPYDPQPFGLRSYTYRKGKLEERRVYIPLKAGAKATELTKTPALALFNDQAKHVNLMITDRRGVVPQLDMKDGLKAEAFNPQGRKLLAQYEKEFKLKVDTLAYQSRDEFTLYYP